MSESSLIEKMEYARDHAAVVDLSYTLEERMPAWPTQARYGSVVYESYEFGDPAIHSMITMSEHTGTHIDAPRHFVPGGRPVDELPVTTVMGRGVRIDASFLKPRETLSLEKVREFEAENGEVKRGDIILLRFGWDEKYALQPHCAGFLKDWPGLSGEAAEYFLGKKAAAVGCDTLSLDAFGDASNVCHHTLLGHGIPIIENICNLSKLPAFSYVVGLPNKFKGGSGSPIRLVAFVEK
jgi:kynurenine formamidase